MEKYRDWGLLESLPDGWKFDKTVGSPVCGYEFATNGKNIFQGRERALVRVERKAQEWLKPSVHPPQQVPQKEAPTHQVIDGAYARTVNELARKKFEERMLRDIRIDLAICEIEGWCKMEYIRELRRLLAGLAKRGIGSPSTQVEMEME